MGQQRLPAPGESFPVFDPARRRQTTATFIGRFKLFDYEIEAMAEAGIDAAHMRTSFFMLGGGRVTDRVQVLDSAN